MNRYLMIMSALLTVFLIGCAGAEPQGNELPSDLNGLRAVQKEKRAELKALEEELAKIDSLILTLDSSISRRVPIATLDTLVRFDFDHFVEVQGVVKSQDEVAATSEMGGRIVQLMIQEGQRVQAGQLIARVDDEVLQSQKQEILTQLELAKDVFERQKRLWEKEIGTEIEYLRSKTQKESLERSLATLEANIKKTNVYAPKSGVVDRLNLKAGEFAAPGMPVATIVDGRRLKVVLEVPENYLGRVQEGDVINVHFPSINYDQKALVTLIGSTINSNNRTFIAEARIKLDDASLIRPNMLAVAQVNDYHLDSVLQVPINLVQQEVSGKDYVLVKGLSEEGPVAVKKYVEIGKVFNGMAVIESGLEEGQMILVEGARGLSANERFRIKQ